MACNDFWIKLNGVKINHNDSDDDWRRWMSDHWANASEGLKASLIAIMDSRGTMKCFKPRLDAFNSTDGSCWNIRYTLFRGTPRQISTKDNDDKWYNWFNTVYSELTEGERNKLKGRLSPNARKCFNRRLGKFNTSKAKNQAKCLPTSKEFKTVQSYNHECINTNPMVQNTLNRFYGSSDDSVANYQTIFQNKRDLAQSEVLEINTIIRSFPRAMDDLNVQIESKKKEIRKIEEDIKLTEHKTEAEEQQFVDDKKSSGKTVKKYKVNTLQDYLLAAFFVAYFFFGLVAIFYVSKINEYSWKIFGMMTLLVTLIGGLMTAVINYVG
jgi:hypothetical protein